MPQDFNHFIDEVNIGSDNEGNKPFSHMALGYNELKAIHPCHHEWDIIGVVVMWNWSHV